MTTATNGDREDVRRALSRVAALPDRITGFRNEQYDLISVLYHVLEGATTSQSYIQDAEKSGDQELCQFFKEIQQQQIQQAERAKQLLASRVQ